MLEGTLLGLVYVVAVCAGIFGLYIIAFIILYIIKKCKQNNNVQRIEHDTINDSLIVRIMN